MILAAVVAAQIAVSLVLRTRGVHAVLRARLERALGRPVEVGRFDVSVWSGLRLEAHYVTVSEEPQFGSEFVLRADAISASPDWRSLVGGRLLFYRFSFDRPSLNLVRAPDGRWNFQAWATGWRNLGMAAVAAPPLAGSGGGRVDGIAVSNGRINFKRGADKLPFALVNVNGRLSPESDGRWSITFDAQPLRAGVTLQDAGTMQLKGVLPGAMVSGFGGGRAVNAGPAEFSVEWRKASLSDALRLIAGDDFGVRGTLDASLSAQNPPPSPATAAGAPAVPASQPPVAAGEVGPAWHAAWKISGTLRLADVHRWDLPLQSGLPGLNLAFNAAASADRREWEFREIVLEARRSNLRGSAAFGVGENRHASLRVVTASIHLDDLLAWYRAFHPGVRPGTWVDGYLGADVELEGWPPRIVHGALATTGARLNIAGETRSVELRRAVIEADSKGALLGESQIGVGDDDAGVRLAANANWTAGLPFEASLTGSTAHLAELSTAVAALGLSAEAQPLRAEGSAFVRLNWKGSARPWLVSTLGTLALEDVTLSGGALRSPISVGSARLDYLPVQRRLQFSATKAFGTTWTGTARAATIAGPWEFALTADRLNPAALVRGFSNPPPENTSLLSRILPAQAASTLARERPAWPAWLRGEGKITALALDVGRLEFERVQGSITLGERQVVLEGAEGGLYGGRVRGEVRADFGEQPRYDVRTEFDGVSVGALSAVAISTRLCCSGAASGHVELTATGWDRDALFASLAGTGHAEVRSGALLTLDLPATIAERALRAGRTAPRAASGDFLLSAGHIQLEKFVFDLPSSFLEGSGSVSYRGEIDVKVFNTLPGGRPAASTHGVQITGTLAAPQIAPGKSPR